MAIIGEQAMEHADGRKRAAAIVRVFTPETALTFS
jgi:hypothetical protein